MDAQVLYGLAGLGCVGKGMADWRAGLALALCLWSSLWSLSGLLCLLCFGKGSFRVRRVDRDFL